MSVVDTFGRYVEKWSIDTPERARTLLKLGWSAQGFKFRRFPNKSLLPSDQYLAQIMMDAMLAPLKHPDETVIVSILTPCELLQEAGLYPCNAEGFSCYLTGSHAERIFLQNAEDSGISETLCSYHKTFIGAAQAGLFPKPRCIVYTSLACDANLLTFRRLAEFYQVPSFVIDVPSGQTLENVQYIAAQLRQAAVFLKKHTGRNIQDDGVAERLARSQRTQEKFDRFQTERAEKYIPADLVSPLYAGFTAHLLLGTEQQERYVDMLLEDVKKASPAKGKRLYWMHTIPFWSQAVKNSLLLNEDAQIVGCELSQATDITKHSGDPYEDMACRLVYHSFNGSISRRIEAGIRHTRQAGAHGAVWFNHWGCKHTLGGSQLARKKFEEAGIPLLILDGDGCDSSHGGEGQTATRLQAFLEML